MVQEIEIEDLDTKHLGGAREQDRADAAAEVRRAACALMGAAMRLAAAAGDEAAAVELR